MAAEEQEISPGDSHDSEEHDDVGSSTLIALSSEQDTYTQSVMHQSHQLLILTVIIFVVSQLIKQLLMRSKGVSELMSTIPAGLADVSMFLSVGTLQPWLPHNIRSRFIGSETTKAAFVVVEAYALLLLISIRYIITAIIPLTILAFIFALRGKFGNLWDDHKPRESMRSMKQMKILLASNCAQLFFVVMNLYKGHQDGTFIVSHFVLFFSTAVSALAVMVSNLPVGVSPGVANVVPIMQKTCIVALLIAIHITVAEWLGEDIVFACMPELVAVLVWFTIHYDHGGYAVSVQNLTSGKSDFIILSSIIGILAYLYTSFRKSLYSRAFCITCSSSALSYISMRMLHQWPESFSHSKGLIQLLMFSSKVCFSTLGFLSVELVGNWVLNEPKFAFCAIVILTSLLLFLLMFGRKLSMLFLKALGVIALEEQPTWKDGIFRNFQRERSSRDSGVYFQ